MDYYISINFYKKSAESPLEEIAYFNTIGSDKDKLQNDLDWLSDRFLELMNSSGCNIEYSYTLKNKINKICLRDTPTDIQEELLQSDITVSPCGSFLSAERALVFSTDNIDNSWGHLIRAVTLRLKYEAMNRP